MRAALSPKPSTSWQRSALGVRANSRGHRFDGTDARSDRRGDHLVTARLGCRRNGLRPRAGLLLDPGAGGRFSCMLFDHRGRFLSKGTASVPSFTGTGPATLAGMLQHVPVETLEDGDVLLTNDPWIGTGHGYAINLVKPVVRPR